MDRLPSIPGVVGKPAGVVVTEAMMSSTPPPRRPNIDPATPSRTVRSIDSAPASSQLASRSPRESIAASAASRNLLGSKVSVELKGAKLAIDVESAEGGGPVVKRRSNKAKTWGANAGTPRADGTTPKMSSILEAAIHRSGLRRRRSVSSSALASTAASSRRTSKTNSLANSLQSQLDPLFAHQPRFEALQWPRQNDSDIAPEAVRSALVHYLSRKHSFEKEELSPILKQFDAAAGKSGGKIDLLAFREMLRNLVERSELKDEVIISAWEATSPLDEEIPEDTKTADVDMDGFLTWYRAEHGWSGLQAINTWVASGDIINMLAKENDVPVSVMKQVKAKFEQVDLDRSGNFDLSEFTAMMQKALGSGGGEDSLSEELSKRLWQELDEEGDGLIDFFHFAPWYLKHFDPDTEQLKS